jgi:hypothetical protein
MVPHPAPARNADEDDNDVDDDAIDDDDDDAIDDDHDDGDVAGGGGEGCASASTGRVTVAVGPVGKMRPARELCTDASGHDRRHASSRRRAAVHAEYNA